MSLKQHGARIGLLIVLVGALLGWFGEITASPDVDRWLTEARGE